MAININKIILLLIIFISIQLSGCSKNSKIIKNNDSQTNYEHNETLPAQEARKLVVKEAISLIGKPYKPSGNSPREGFDCSGLAFYSYLKAGTLLPRSSKEQYQSAHKVKKIKPGDLVFFITKIRGSHIDHVGIYIGEQKFIHAPGKGRSVETASLTETYWKKRYKGAGNYLD
jgi:cell wall-associated NlpC family hydrolase